MDEPCFAGGHRGLIWVKIELGYVGHNPFQIVAFVGRSDLFLCWGWGAWKRTLFFVYGPVPFSALSFSLPGLPA